MSKRVIFNHIKIVLHIPFIDLIFSILKHQLFHVPIIVLLKEKKSIHYETQTKCIEFLIF